MATADTTPLVDYIAERLKGMNARGWISVDDRKLVDAVIEFVVRAGAQVDHIGRLVPPKDKDDPTVYEKSHRFDIIRALLWAPPADSPLFSSREMAAADAVKCLTELWAAGGFQGPEPAENADFTISECLIQRDNGAWATWWYWTDRDGVSTEAAGAENDPHRNTTEGKTP